MTDVGINLKARIHLALVPLWREFSRDNFLSNDPKFSDTPKQCGLCLRVERWRWLEAQAIQYLGAYVARSAIADARSVEVSAASVIFTWKDRACNNARRTETVSGSEFVRHNLRHVLPLGLRSIRRYGYCHPSAKTTRERIAFRTGRPLLLGEPLPAPTKPGFPCPCCGAPMIALLRLPALWKSGRAPPPYVACAA